MNYKSLLFDDINSVEKEKPSFVKTDKANQPVQFDKNFGLEKKIEIEGKKQQYGLTILFEEEGASNEIKYELSIIYLGLSREQNFLYQLERTSPVYVNEVIPDLLADKLAYEAGKIFYPLMVEIRKDGKFLAVKNGDEIRKRWVKTKADIEGYFEGAYASKYIQLMNERLAEDDYIQICFRDDWFIKTYFQSIYKPYNQGLKVGENLHFPNLEPKSLGYKTVECVNPVTNHFGAIQLEHQGHLEQDEIQQARGNYQAKYILNPASKAIQIILAEWTVNELTEKKVTLKLFIMGELGNDKLSTEKTSLSIENLVFIDDNKTNKRKQGFWNNWLK